MTQKDVIVEAFSNLSPLEQQQTFEAIEKTYGYTKGTKPYGKSFIDSILEVLEKADIQLTDEEKERLRALAKETEKTGEIFTILPQEETGTRKRELPNVWKLMQEAATQHQKETNESEE